MYFGSSNSYSGLDGKYLVPFIVLAVIGAFALLGVVGFGVLELIHHLVWK